MKKFIRIICATSLVCILLSFIGCVHSDVDIKIEEGGKASMSFKVAIDEETYDKLLAIATAKNNNAEDFSGTIAISELDKFVKDENNHCYVYTAKTQQYDSYDKLADALKDIRIIDDIPLFKAITITSRGNAKYTFDITTMEINPEMIKEAFPVENLPTDWFTLTVNVSMPGEITAIEHDANTTVKQTDENTISFTVADTSKEHNVIVSSKVNTPYIVRLIIFAAVTLCVAVILTVTFVQLRKDEREQDEIMAEKQEEITDEMEEDNNED